MTNKKVTNVYLDELSYKIIGACIEVHKIVGPGLLESAYEQCLCREFDLRGIKFQRQVPLSIEYKGVKLDCGYRIDILVEDSIILELKAIKEFLPIHKAQVLTYLRLKKLKLGLIINFCSDKLIDGVKRVVNEF